MVARRHDKDCSGVRICLGIAGLPCARIEGGAASGPNPGCREDNRGGYVLRNDKAAEVEFVVINLFDSYEAVRAFAGPDYSTPAFEPEARLLLSRVETIANHYEVRVNTA
jgi:hypothetical protein